MLRDEIKRYTELSGNDGEHTPIGIIGAYLDGYEKGLESRENIKGEWIPVSERLPKDGQSVLFCDIDEDIMIGYHVKGRPETHFSQDGTYEDMKNVFAWQPLPEPYHKGGE